MHYDLTDLRLFVAIAEAHNLTRGAERAHLAPSSASHRLQQLENALGTPLFLRQARGVQLTRAGEALLRHARQVFSEIRTLQTMPEEEVMAFAKNIGAPYELCLEVRELGRLPVVNFAAGGIATPADAALMMQIGVDGVFVGSGIFKSGDPAKRAAAIVKATTHYNEPKLLAEISRNLGEPMVGRQVSNIPEQDLLAGRGW